MGREQFVEEAAWRPWNEHRPLSQARAGSGLTWVKSGSFQGGQCRGQGRPGPVSLVSPVSGYAALPGGLPWEAPGVTATA